MLLDALAVPSAAGGRDVAGAGELVRLGVRLSVARGVSATTGMGAVAAGLLASCPCGLLKSFRYFCAVSASCQPGICETCDAICWMTACAGVAAGGACGFAVGVGFAGAVGVAFGVAAAITLAFGFTSLRSVAPGSAAGLGGLGEMGLAVGSTPPSCPCSAPVGPSTSAMRTNCSFGGELYATNCTVAA